MIYIENVDSHPASSLWSSNTHLSPGLDFQTCLDRFSYVIDADTLYHRRITKPVKTRLGCIYSNVYMMYK